MRVLNIDDNDENRYMVETLLTASGYEVVSAVNGAEGLEQLQSGGIDLIISDILMPVMDGFHLCRRVKADDKLKTIPFIFYTATYTGPQDEAFAMKVGADKFLQKPCEPDLFLQAVQDLLAAGGKGDIASYEGPPIPEKEALTLYNERLVRKLEKKMLELENEVLARQQTEQTLRQSEKKYRSLYNSIRDAILVVEMNRSILDCNQAFVDLFGYSRNEITGRNAATICKNEEEF
jgi:CheY-like chemotaxis protein